MLTIWKYLGCSINTDQYLIEIIYIRDIIYLSTQLPLDNEFVDICGFYGCAPLTSIN